MDHGCSPWHEQVAAGRFRKWLIGSLRGKAAGANATLERAEYLPQQRCAVKEYFPVDMTLIIKRPRLRQQASIKIRRSSVDNLWRK
jgi:hypothetical protein